jgi:segregation and condensation protein A
MEPNVRESQFQPTPYEVRLPDYQGPLDLLLSLIEQEELDITKLALAQVTDQYLAYIDILKELEPDILTDFLVVAAKLVLIKSKALLPKPPAIIDEAEDDVDLGDELARQLQVYKRFKEIGAELRDLEAIGQRSFVRVAPPPKIEGHLETGTGSLETLVAAAKRAMVVRPPEPGIDEVVAPIWVTVGHQMSLIRRQLASHSSLSFEQLLGKATDRVQVIVTLLAVLELIKRRVIDIEQPDLFGDILIYKKEDAPELSEADWSELSNLTEIS